MAQDLRKLFEKEREEEKYPMKKGHKNRFLNRMEKELPQKRKPSFRLLKIAASLLVLLSIGLYTYQQIALKTPVEKKVVDIKPEVEEPKVISLGDLSPDLKKVESYYVANINLELSKLEISNENKAMVEGFMDQLGQLNHEYLNLNLELNEIGPNDQTITALIQNLQLRLQLLQKLKKKLNQLKTSKNEQVETNTI